MNRTAAPLLASMARLEAALRKLTGMPSPRPALSAGEPYLDAEEMQADLAIIEESLIEHRGAALTEPRLRAAPALA